MYHCTSLYQVVQDFVYQYIAINGDCSIQILNRPQQAQRKKNWHVVFLVVSRASPSEQLISCNTDRGLSIYECHWWVLLWKTTHFCGFLKLAHLHEDLAHRAASMILRVHLDKMHVDLVSDLALVEGILYESASVGVGVNWSYTYRVIWVRICLVLFESQYDHNHVSWSSQMSPVTSEVRCWWLLFGSMPVHVFATWIDTTCAYIDSDSVSHNQPFSHG